MLSLPADSGKAEVNEDGVPVHIKLPIKHVLSRELQLYFEKITELTVSSSESTLFEAALESLATDSGINPLAPYFTFFIEDEVRLKILRNLKPHLRLLEPEMQLEKQKNERHEAWLVYGALMRAAGLCVHDRLKMLPSLPSAPPHTACKSNSKVVTTSSNKRKANMDNMMHQPPLKKSATDSSVGVAAANSVAVNIAEASSGGYSTNTDSNMQSSRPLSNNNIAGSSSRREIVGGQRLKASATLKLAWK